MSFEESMFNTWNRREFNLYKLDVGDWSFESLLQQMNYITTSQFSFSPTLDLTIDFNYSDFIRPYKLALIASFVESLRTTVDVTVNCINMSGRNIDYFSRMDFFKEVGYEYNESFLRQDGTGRFIPIKRIKESNRYNLPGEVSRIINDQWEGIDKSIVGSLDWSISEIVDNIFNHSGTPIDGFLTAQYYPQKNEIDLIVIDSGIGIAKRLQENPDYAHIENTDALSLAIEQGVTVNPKTNMGAGLYYSKRIIEENRGNLFLHSKNAHLVINTGGGINVHRSHNWDGTIIRLVINTDILIDPKNVWDNIPSTVEDFLYDETLW